MTNAPYITGGVIMESDINEFCSTFEFSGPTLTRVVTVRVQADRVKYGKNIGQEVTLNHSGCGALSLVQSLEFSSILAAAQLVAARYVANPLAPSK
jgi:hypothetical protein